MASQNKTREKMIRARSRLLMEHPFFGHLALQMELKEDRSCHTAWSDGEVLAYNPVYANMLSGEKLKGVIGHLVMHPACQHHLRRQGRDPRQWNMACDYAINWILLEAGLTLPDGYLDDPDLRGKNADEIFTQLYGESHGAPQNYAVQANKNKEDSDGEKIERPESLDKTGEKDGESEDGQESESSDSNEEQEAGKDQEGDSSDPGKTGEVREPPTIDPESTGSGQEDSEDDDQWRIRLAQAAAQARSMGDFPANLERLVEDLLHPRIDWRQVLTRFIQASARYDYTWMPPNRRYVHQGIYLPGMRSDDLPEVVVAVDTSGSISSRELEQFAAELSAILETAAMKVHVLYCDTKVSRAETVHRQDLPLRLAPMGGGGTDFRPPFEWVDHQRVHPLCLIYLTDMACNRFPEEPPYPVLWACIGEEAVTPPFGELLIVN